MTDPLDALADLDHPAWLVGGTVRDRLLGRPTSDYDIALDGDPGETARSLARRVGGHPFELSEHFGVWRVVARDRSWQLDLLPLTGRSIEDDLANRDLTVNAIAQPLADGEPVDPFGGLRDLRERTLRMVSAGAFDSDPLRVLRLARLACELDFVVEPQTAATAAASAPGLGDVAPERVFAELKRLIASDEAVRGIRLLEELGIAQVVLPELFELHGIEQNRFHHLDVHAHTLEVLAATIALERDPQAMLGEHAAAVDDYMRRPLANELTRWQALRFGSLLHDIAKPQTRGVTAEGRVTFFGHDAAGSETSRELLRRLRASERLIEYVAALTRHHLRLGFLVHEMPLSRRAVYRYLRACEPVPVDVTVLSVADRLATRGDRSEEAIAKHLELAEQMLGEALRFEADPPRPPIRGDELARELGLRPGPELGKILAELEEASFAAEVVTREDAIELARGLLRDGSIGSPR
ncbi:MAG TPA: HD domain-containing protein [Solirubrobacteraceae bacterium]